MSFATKFNKGSKFDIDTSDMEFRSLAELKAEFDETTTYPLKGIYINSKSKFGAHPVFITDKYLVDVPSHMIDTVNDVLADQTAIDDIKAGKVGFKIYSYTSQTYNRECLNVEFVDVE